MYLDTINYTYDINNRLTQKVTEFGNDSSTEIRTYGYDANGNQTDMYIEKLTPNDSTTQPTLHISGVVSTNQTYYRKNEYNALNQLTNVVANGNTERFYYRPDGLRYKLVANGASTVYFGLQGQDVSTEFNTSGNITANYTRGIDLVKNQSGNEETARLQVNLAVTPSAMPTSKRGAPLLRCTT